MSTVANLISALAQPSAVALGVWYFRNDLKTALKRITEVGLSGAKCVTAAPQTRFRWAAQAVAVFQEHCRTGDEHAIADLICDLGHLACGIFGICFALTPITTIAPERTCP